MTASGVVLSMAGEHLAVVHTIRVILLNVTNILGDLVPVVPAYHVPPDCVAKGELPTEAAQ